MRARRMVLGRRPGPARWVRYSSSVDSDAGKDVSSLAWHQASKGGPVAAVGAARVVGVGVLDEVLRLGRQALERALGRTRGPWRRQRASAAGQSQGKSGGGFLPERELHGADLFTDHTFSQWPVVK
jgi:hypothetical protein